MKSKLADQVLLEICSGRQDLIDLGRRFNKEVSQSRDKVNEDYSNENQTAEAIFELEGIPLSKDEKELLNKLDAFNWKDSQVTEFLKAMGGKSNAA